MDKPKLWTKDFITLTLANALYTFGFYMLIPNIPRYIMFRDGSDAQVGLVGACFTATAIVMRLLSPLFLKRLDKKQMLRLGLALSVVVMASCALTVSVGGVIVVRILQGIGFGIVSTVCATLAADLLPDKRRGEGIGYFGMATTVMVAFSPGVGIALSNTLGFGAMFLTASAGPLLSLIVLFFLKPPEAVLKPPPTTVRRSVLSSFFEPAILLQCALLVLYGICRSSEQNFLQLFADEQKIGMTLYYPVQTWISFVAKYITGRLFDKKGHMWSVLPGGIAIFCALTTFSFARSLGVFIIGGVFSGIGLGALLPSLQAWIISRVGADRRAVASAAYYNFYDIGITCGSLVLGALAGSVGYAMTFRYASSAMTAFLIIYVAYLVFTKHKIRLFRT